MEFFVGRDVGPKGIQNPAKASVLKDLQLLNDVLGNFSEFWSIQ